jgi:hypothetical protein
MNAYYNYIASSPLAIRHLRCFYRDHTSNTSLFLLQDVDLLCEKLLAPMRRVGEYVSHFVALIDENMNPTIATSLHGGTVS